MKKLLLIIFGALLISSSQAQVIFEENFDAGAIPVPGWLIMGNPDNFANPASSMAGGTAPELQFDNTPAFPTSTIRIISPQINSTGATQLIIRFKHMFDRPTGGTAVNLSVATRSSSSGTWNVVWTKAASASIPAEGVNVLVNNANVGSATFQLCFVLNGNSSTMKNWYIDNVEVLKPFNLDAAMSSVNLPPLFVGPQTIQGQFSNLGNTAINSLDVSWRVDDGEVHTTPYTGLNIATGASADYLSADQMNLPEGDYMLYVWVSNINGLSNDDDPLNDTLIRELSIPDKIVYYKPLFEEFTSSTCGPCASFNNSTLNPFIASHTDDELTLIKYQMNWPGSGDPYYTAEGGVRRSYYGVNAVPDLFIDGQNVGENAAGVNGGYNATAGTMATVGIESVHNVSGNNVIIDCNILPDLNSENVKVHVVIVERITTQNVATNGETQFHHVMMKMVPGANGTTANLVAGETLNLQFTVDMSTTFVEEMDDLMVAIFIQKSDKSVLQSGYSVEAGAIITSSIENNAINVPVNEPITIAFSQPMRMIGGAPLTNNNVASVINFREVDATGAPVGFTATINDAKTLITITPNPNLKYLQEYYLEILPLENLLAVPTQNFIINFTTLLNINVISNPVIDFRLFPNPANNTLNINNLNNVKTLEIYSIVGNLIRTMDVSGNSGQYSINISNIPSGLYILKAKGTQTEKAVRFVISK